MVGEFQYRRVCTCAASRSRTRTFWRLRQARLLQVLMAGHTPMAYDSHNVEHRLRRATGHDVLVSKISRMDERSSEWGSRGGRKIARLLLLPVTHRKVCLRGRIRSYWLKTDSREIGPLHGILVLYGALQNCRLVLQIRVALDTSV